jgi:hypothetical protein
MAKSREQIKSKLKALQDNFQQMRDDQSNLNHAFVHLGILSEMVEDLAELILGDDEDDSSP